MWSVIQTEHGYRDICLIGWMQRKGSDGSLQASRGKRGQAHYIPAPQAATLPKCLCVFRFPREQAS